MNFPWELRAKQEQGGGVAVCSSLNVMLQVMIFQSIPFLKNEWFFYLLQGTWWRVPTILKAGFQVLLSPLCKTVFVVPGGTRAVLFSLGKTEN